MKKMVRRYEKSIILLQYLTNNKFAHKNAWLTYLDTARHLRIFLGTRASCSTSGNDKSSLPCHRIFPVSASRRFIQLILKPLRISSARDGILHANGLAASEQLFQFFPLLLRFLLLRNTGTGSKILMLESYYTRTKVLFELHTTFQQFVLVAFCCGFWHASLIGQCIFRRGKFKNATYFPSNGYICFIWVFF